jgi:hypothetical protein
MCRDDRAVSQHLEAVHPWPLPRPRGSVVRRRLVACGSGLLALRCLVGLQRLLDNDSAPMAVTTAARTREYPDAA